MVCSRDNENGVHAERLLPRFGFNRSPYEGGVLSFIAVLFVKAPKL
jgi:hypothetical protein